MKNDAQSKATRLIRLAGVHARGEHEFAVVDADLFDDLDRWAWRAKPNAAGTKIYACRTERIGDRNVMHRLHRVVLGIPHGAPDDVRFLNGDPLDCRRENLRYSGRSETVKNAPARKRYGHCAECGERFAYWSKAATETICSEACRTRRKVRHNKQALAQERTARQAARSDVSCGWCKQTFTPKKLGAKFCSSHCRHTAKNHRNATTRKVRAVRAPARSPIPCACCGAGFVPRTAKHIYCSRRCRWRVGNAKSRND